MKKVTDKLVEILKNESPDFVADKLLERFDSEIVPYEDENDPARPSIFREEFESFIKDSVREGVSISTSIKVKERETRLKINVGDNEKLGFGERLNDSTTDGLKIIGTILHGIVGNYVLITTNMTSDKDPEGRFGTAFLVPEAQYRDEALSKGWDPNKPIWKFSNFPGIPDFFENIPFGELIEKASSRLGGEVGG